VRYARYTIYIIILVIILFIYLVLFGFLDSKIIYVDNFMIKRPIFYKCTNNTEHIILSGDNISTGFLCSKTYGAGGVFYSFHKEANMEKYTVKLKYLFRKSNIDMEKCDVMIEKKLLQNEYEINTNNEIEYYIHHVNVYPYFIDFVEINLERAANSINNFCIDKSINFMESNETYDGNYTKNLAKNVLKIRNKAKETNPNLKLKN